MDFITEIIPVIGGSTSILSLAMLFQIYSLKQQVARERNNLLNFIEEEKEKNKELDRRLYKLEIQATKRWSTWNPD